MWFLLLAQLWYDVPDTNAIVSGHWQSCQEQGEWGEAARDHHLNGKLQWSLHLGPYDDFAIFKGEEPEGDDHDSPLNLLGKYHHALSLPVRNGRRTWTIPSLGLWVSVVQGGGSRDECSAWYVRIEPIARHR